MDRRTASNSSRAQHSKQKGLVPSSRYRTSSLVMLSGFLQQQLLTVACWVPWKMTHCQMMLALCKGEQRSLLLQQ